MKSNGILWWSYWLKPYLIFYGSELLIIKGWSRKLATRYLPTYLVGGGGLINPMLPLLYLQASDIVRPMRIRISLSHMFASAVVRRLSRKRPDTSETAGMMVACFSASSWSFHLMLHGLGYTPQPTAVKGSNILLRSMVAVFLASVVEASTRWTYWNWEKVTSVIFEASPTLQLE